MYENVAFNSCSCNYCNIILLSIMKSSKNVHLMCNILKITKLPNKSDNCLETSFRFHML